jgi:hypothetical protein
VFPEIPVKLENVAVEPAYDGVVGLILTPGPDADAVKLNVVVAATLPATSAVIVYGLPESEEALVNPSITIETDSPAESDEVVTTPVLGANPSVVVTPPAVTIADVAVVLESGNPVNVTLLPDSLLGTVNPKV